MPPQLRRLRYTTTHPKGTTMQRNAIFHLLLICLAFVTAACASDLPDTAMMHADSSVAVSEIRTPTPSARATPRPSASGAFRSLESAPPASKSSDPSNLPIPSNTTQSPSSAPLADIEIVAPREIPPPSLETAFWSEDHSTSYTAKPAPVLIDAYTKVQRIGEDLPEYVFDFAVYDELTPEEWEWYLKDTIFDEETARQTSGHRFTYITVSEKDTHKLVQTLRIPVTDPFRFYDGNFDGFLDLKYVQAHKGNSCAYIDVFHFWDPESNAYASESRGYSDAFYNERHKVVVSTSHQTAASRRFAVDGAVQAELHRDYLYDDALLMERFGKTHADFEGTDIIPMAYCLDGNNDIYGLFDETTQTFDNPEMQAVYDTWFGADGYLPDSLR